MSKAYAALLVLAVAAPAVAWWALRPAPLPDQQIRTSFSFDHRLCDGGCYSGAWTPELCAGLPYWGEVELEKCMAAAARFRSAEAAEARSPSP